MLASPFLFPAVLVAGLVLAVNNTSGAYVTFNVPSVLFEPPRALELLNCEYCTGPCARVPRVSRVC